MAGKSPRSVPHPMGSLENRPLAWRDNELRRTQAVDRMLPLDRLTFQWLNSPERPDQSASCNLQTIDLIWAFSIRAVCGGRAKVGTRRRATRLIISTIMLESLE